MPIRSVLDVGCVRGTWLSVWHGKGIDDFLGIDGDYVKAETLGIDPDRFIRRDLGQPFRLGRKFDLVQCLEVAEHLPGDRARGFIADLAAHGRVVLFSAAPPGQGGKWHINEQPYSYWRAHFADEGFVLVDCIRPLLQRRAEVAPWYRFNTFLFVHSDVIGQLPPSIRSFELNIDDAVPDVSPFLYRARKSLIRLLPFRIKQLLADAVERMHPS
jgi:hypothetical protein